LSLVYVSAIQATAWWVLTQSGIATPPLAWLVFPAAISVTTIALLERWNAIAHAAMATTVLAGGLFLAYVVSLTAQAHLGPLSVAFAGVLVAMQAFALLLLVASSYEILDVMGRVRWTRASRPQPTTDYFPTVSLHVPAYNEPPEMVKETLDALAKLDYPNYEVIVIDNNTTDEQLWRPIEAHCKALGFKFFHLDNWPGFKSGALNYALTQTASDAKIIGVIDSDYVVEPTYLKACVGYFKSPDLAFVQTPQDYRDVPADDRYAMACYHSYLYFFKVSMASRNEHNGIIFAGTMGLIRKSVLQELGGWDEWCITEDAELSLRILDRGYQSVYVDVSYGRGLMPLNFEGLKKQRFRWAFGGMQILKAHWRSLMPWARWRDPAHRLSLAQQWDYLIGGLQWLSDPLTFGFTLLLLLGAGALALGGSLFMQPMASAVVVAPFLFIFIGISRFVWVLRHRVRCTWGQALSAFTILLSLTWVVTLACVLGLIKPQGVFLRTPKKRATVDPWHAARIVSRETMIAGLCLTGAVALAWTVPPSPAMAVMIGLLLWQTLIYAAAPVSSLWSYRSEARSLQPAYVANSSRTTGLRFSSMVLDRPVARAVFGSAMGVSLFFYLAITLAPEREQLFRANPLQAPFVASALITTPTSTQIKAVLFLEEHAAIKADVDRAVRLWDPDGVIRDANYTVNNEGDDRIWQGADGIRQRYVQEFSQRRYLSLAHTDASVFIEGDRATVVNDLRAEIQTAGGIQTVFLSRGDRWTFTKRKDGWRITELVLNRAPR
jgi:cellulose synthase/poly-beta-1,6-N-acetylglucosamine synthase-like glycosyltransferase/ketosteroid isomerase-like protein